MTRSQLLALLTSTLLAGCTLAPDMEAVFPGLPGAFKEAAPVEEAALKNSGWQEAVPQDALDKGEWWQIFGDAGLNDLQKQALEHNQNLRAASARLNQARAGVRQAAADYYPQASLGANVARAKIGGSVFGQPGAGIPPFTSYTVNGAVSYEVDLLGRVSDRVRSVRFDAEAAEADYKNILLLLQADVAQAYFTLRSLDEERRLLVETVQLRQDSFDIAQKRLEAGYSDALDAARAQTELATTKAEALNLDQRRASQIHALAVLVGATPETFDLAQAPLPVATPVVPAGTPASLIERRPDISSAIRAMQAANSRIGVARSAFFPSLILSASGGWQDDTPGGLFSAATRIWALGPLGGTALTLPIFQGGRLTAELDIAKLRFEEQAANYQQTVLAGLRETEDRLSDIRFLAAQAEQQELARAAAADSSHLSDLRYKEGYISYFEYIDAERTRLNAERASVQIKGAQFNAAVGLVKALGGGWDAPKVEEAAQIVPVEAVLVPPAPEAAKAEPVKAPEPPLPNQPVVIPLIPAEPPVTPPE